MSSKGCTTSVIKARLSRWVAVSSERRLFWRDKRGERFCGLTVGAVEPEGGSGKLRDAEPLLFPRTQDFMAFFHL